MSYFLRVIKSTAKIKLIEYYRVFTLYNFALRFFLPVMTIASAWILYNIVFHGTINEFINSTKIDYLTFIVIGNAVYTYLYSSVFLLGKAYLTERNIGTLEPLLLTPSSRTAYMSGIICFAIANSTIDFIVILFIGSIFFNATIFVYHWDVFILGLTLSLVSLYGVGLAVNGITLTFRDRNHTSNILSSLFFVFSGVIIPVSLMPLWAQPIAEIIPLTYGLQLIRLSLVPQITEGDVYWILGRLILITILITLVGIILLKRVEINLKKKAELTVF